LKPQKIIIIIIIIVGLLIVSTCLSCFSIQKIFGIIPVSTCQQTSTTLNIQGNSDFQSQAASEGWSGSGTAESPYLIDGYSIANSEEHLILINNTNLYFQISNCIFDGEVNLNIGIYLINSSHGTINKNQIKRTSSGIVLQSCEEITILENIMQDIGLEEEEDLPLPEYPSGIRLFASDNSTIVKNNIQGTALLIGGGIHLVNSRDNHIEENRIDYTGEGISLYGSCQRNVVFNNSCTRTYAGVGIWPYGDPNNNRDNLFLNNTFDTFQCDGIGVMGFNNTYAYNIIRNGGMVIFESGVQWGIGILISHDKATTINCTIKHNTIKNCFDAILGDAVFCDISHNLILYNKGNAIAISSSSSSNIIASNTLYNNKGYGIELKKEGFHKSKDNIVERNDFIRNNGGNKQAFDWGEDNIFQYNFWDDWTEPDNNMDGIVDTPYSLELDFNEDPYPQTTPNQQHIHLFPPQLIFPNGGEVLNKTVTIQWDPALDTYGHTISYNLYYKTEQEDSWTELASNITNSSYNWDTRDISNGNYTIKVIATCSSGVNAEDVSNAIFTIKNKSTGVPGWTLPIVFLSTVILTIYIHRRRKQHIN